ncbi:MAG: AAA family ATPase [Clostridia bacterium]|nr:AAA family ATPase [Clostridia bacterium]
MEFFPELIGNGSTKNRIGSSILSGRIPHAFLIDGDAGSGKTTLALGIAAALNCEGGKDVLPCGECGVCKRIKRRGHPDVKLLEKSRERASIGVSEVKELRADMFLSATEARYKVYIISDADKLTPEAQNALLIVLEEPPPSVVIILLCEGTDKILTTVKSRTQYIAMSRFSRSELSTYVGAISAEAERLMRLDPEKFDTVIAESGGVIGRALELIDPERSREVKERRDDILAVISAISPKRSYAELHSAFVSLPTKRQDTLSALEELLRALSDMIKHKRAPGAEPVFFRDAESIENACAEMSEKHLLAVYELVLATHETITKNAGIAAALAKLASEIKLI